MAKTYLGQNFLRDSKYIDFMISKIEKLKENNNYSIVFEIGPGKGALTKKIINVYDNINLFEKDETFKDILNDLIGDKGEIIWGDVLKLDINSLIENKKIELENVFIVGNLPYYITSPIFRKFFVDFQGFKGGIFMIQKEVGEKIKTLAHKKSYLWWLLNYRYDVKYLKNVPAKAFSPAPNVDSCIVELIIKNQKPNLKFDRLIEFLDNVSMFKRKTLGKIFKMVKEKNNKFDFNLPDNLSIKRLEDISWEEMEIIVN